MSRILKRPMFRSGGSTNEGIMHGLVNRQGYANKGFVLDEGQLGTDIEAMTAAMNKYAPIPKSKFPMGQIGLNLISGEYAGDGLLQNVAGSARDPYSQWTEADDARRMAQATRRGSAVTTAVGQQYAQELARRKAAGTNLQKNYPDQRSRDEYTTMFLEQKADLLPHQDATVQQAYPEAAAEYYVDIKRGLIRSGSDIRPAGFVPYDPDSGEFNYEDMLPGMYYYDPRLRGKLVIRIPEDADTPENETGYFEIDLKTGKKKKIPGKK